MSQYLATVIIIAIASYLAFHVRHYLAMQTNFDEQLHAARKDAWFEGFATGKDWESRQRSMECNGA